LALRGPKDSVKEIQILLEKKQRSEKVVFTRKSWSSHLGGKTQKQSWKDTRSKSSLTCKRTEKVKDGKKNLLRKKNGYNERILDKETSDRRWIGLALLSETEVRISVRGEKSNVQNGKQNGEKEGLNAREGSKG